MRAMFEKLSDNLNLLMTAAQISADELARQTSVPPSTIKKIRNRYNPNPTLTTLLPLAQFFSVTLGQLVGEEPLSDLSNREDQQQEIVLRHLPLIAWEEAVTWPKTQEQLHATKLTEQSCSANAFALIVDEDNWDRLAKGTVLIIDPSIEPRHSDLVVTHKLGQALPSVRQILFDDGHVYLKPIVQGYNMITFTSEHTILGVVVEYKRCLR